MTLDYCDGKTVEDAINQHNVQLHPLLKIIFGVCLLAGSERSILSPVLLRKDRLKMKGGPPTQDMIDRATRRHHGIGIDVGRRLQEEIDKQERNGPCPHFRRPHLWWAPVGKNREGRELRLREGAVVKPRSIYEVPTGYMGSEL